MIRDDYAGDRQVFRLSRRLAVEITTGPGAICCEWDPSIPKSLTPEELDGYHIALATMVQRLSERMGGAVLVIEA